MMNGTAVYLGLLVLALVAVAIIGLKVYQAAVRRGSPPVLRLMQVTTVVTFLMFFVLCAVPEVGLDRLFPSLVGVMLVLGDLALFVVAACVTIIIGRKHEERDSAQT